MNPLICARCGAFNGTPRVAAPAAGPSAQALLLCSSCGHRQPFLRLPLYCVTGPSGTGKSTAARLLGARLGDRFTVLEQDVLWVGGLRDPSRDHHAFRSTWLRMIAMIHQNGRPAVLCGTVVPPEFEPLPERALFSRIHYLALMADPAVLAHRLRARPAWREWDEERIAETLDYAEWIRSSAAGLEPPMRLLDTTRAPVADTVDAVCTWVERLDDRAGLGR
ncbi:broad-specificity NMP kinase [Murinocardiopsis flavida]|uniref:Broad-specificity NMP kinase n=1 Tax=Murinocardiopsis flavida TaxID=645275 RepID=A0A2P8CUX1_9ACTN|nr:AAA family ATPase [Murinocardiopsis flavida]PSK88774.1 broad-specificity NMP kinase [Murinocardiopsis flavida]